MQPQQPLHLPRQPQPQPPQRSMDMVQPPAFRPPVPEPVQPPTHTTPPSKGPNLKRRLTQKLLLLVVFLALVVIIVVLAIMLASKKASAPSQTSSSSDNVPQAAQAVDVDQTSNSISQDLSSLHDDADFPSSALSDQSLGL